MILLLIHTVGLVLEQACLYFPFVLGSYISISLMKLPDLSLEASYLAGAIIGCQSLVYCGGVTGFASATIVVLASVIGGVIVGGVVGLLTHVAGLPHLLSSILTIGLFHGINQFIIGGSHLSVGSLSSLLSIIKFPASNPELGIVVVLAALLSLLVFLLFKTQLGYSFAILGNNTSFFKNYHISSGYVFITGLLIAHGLSGFAGSLVAQSSGMVDITMGFGIVLLSLTSLILGRACVRGKKPFTVLVPIIGTVIYFSLQQLLLSLSSSLMVSFDMKYFTMLQSMIVLIALIIERRRALPDDSRARVDHLGV